MTTISLHKPKKLLKEISFPTAWNELEGPELLSIAKTLISPEGQTAQGKVHIFMSLLRHRVNGQGGKAPRSWQAFFRLRGAPKSDAMPHNWEALLNIQDAATAGLDAVKFIYDKNELTRQPVPTIDFPFHTHLSVTGPQDNFDTLTCGEFEDAETFFSLFLQEPNINNLAMLAAILWRPKDRPYIWIKDSVQYTWPAQSYAKHFAALPAEQLYLMFLWFGGCLATLPAIFTYVYDGAKDADNGHDAAAFTKCIHAGAGEKNGTRQQIRMMPLKEFLFEMDLQAKQAKEQEEEARKNH